MLADTQYGPGRTWQRQVLIRRRNGREEHRATKTDQGDLIMKNRLLGTDLKVSAIGLGRTSMTNACSLAPARRRCCGGSEPRWRWA